MCDTYLLNVVDLLCYVICVWNHSWKNSHDTRRGILAVMKCRFEKHIEGWPLELSNLVSWLLHVSTRFGWPLVTWFLGYYTFLHVWLTVSNLVSWLLHISTRFGFHTDIRTFSTSGGFVIATHITCITYEIVCVLLTLVVSFFWGGDPISALFAGCMFIMYNWIMYGSVRLALWTRYILCGHFHW